MKLVTAMTTLVLAGLFTTGCIIVVDEKGETDAEWIGSYETKVEVRTESDRILAQRVSERLATEPDLRLEDISVSASNEVITLHGRVYDMATFQQAVEAALQVDGVERVVSRLTLDVRGS